MPRTTPCLCTFGTCVGWLRAPCASQAEKALRSESRALAERKGNHWPDGNPSLCPQLVWLSVGVAGSVLARHIDRANFHPLPRHEKT